MGRVEQEYKFASNVSTFGYGLNVVGHGRLFLAGCCRLRVADMGGSSRSQRELIGNSNFFAEMNLPHTGP